MPLTPLTALSPLDGRYEQKLTGLRPIMSEYGLIYYRLLVEIRWLITLSDHPEVTEVKPLNDAARKKLEHMIENFSLQDADQVKTIEQTTNHDVKAIEYFIAEQCKRDKTLEALIPYIHFGCTSEDINNIAYALMLNEARQSQLSPSMKAVIDKLKEMAHYYADIPMLARTHGQTASPTTLGKELANVLARLNTQYQQFTAIPMTAKFNGAVGNFNAHAAAYPDVDWPSLSQHFITELGLEYNPYTTQIEPHDHLAQWLQTLVRFNNVLIDFNRDVWGYISLGYFKQKAVKHEIGSSTMPHKVNPIDFENSEGNLGIANAFANHMANKLPLSRWQRDLTDSTVLRNLGSVCGYSLIAYQATLKGLNKLNADKQRLQQDLEPRWEVLAEAIQMTMRRYGISDSYEQLKALTRGKAIDANTMANFIDQLAIPDKAKKHLQALTPDNYLGYAISLAKKIGDN